MTLDRDLLLNRRRRKPKGEQIRPEKRARKEIESWIGSFRTSEEVRRADLEDGVFLSQHLNRQRDEHVRQVEFSGIAVGLFVGLFAVTVAVQAWWFTALATLAIVFALVAVSVFSRLIRGVDRQLDLICDVATRIPEAPSAPTLMRVPIQHVRLGRWSLIRFDE